MDRKTAIRKLRACLRLAASSNPNEAAAALRQAQALMREHGLTEDDAEIESRAAPLRHRRTELPPYIIELIDLVADAFGTSPLLAPNDKLNGLVIRFYGPPAAAEVSATAFTVLRRQLDRDIQRHTKRIRKRANKEARGNEFGCGWTAAVRHKLPASDSMLMQRERMDDYVQSGGAGKTVSRPAREIAGKSRLDDRVTGFMHGDAARVFDAVEQNKQRLLGGPTA